MPASRNEGRNPGVKKIHLVGDDSKVSARSTLGIEFIVRARSPFNPVRGFN